MANNIVTINVSQTIGATPSLLQRTGLIVTQGGTNTATGTVSLITQLPDFTAIKAASGTPLTTLTADLTTFFGQGSANSVYVLELGTGTTAAGVTALTTFLTNNPSKYYAIKVPDGWDAEATFPTLAAAYASTSAKTYFFVRVTNSTYTTFATATPYKSIVMLLPDTTTPATESAIMAMFWKVLNYNPSNTNQVTPMAFSYMVGVTPLNVTQALQATYKAAYVNFVATGAEGGISNTILKWGTTADGRDFTYWYSVDWVQINVQIALANEIINGSNNPIAPLFYNQAGINRLQLRAQSTVNSGIAFGMVLAPATVAAVDFQTYTLHNPNDYKVGLYQGLSLTYTPARGFTAITFNINVTDFVQQ